MKPIVLKNITMDFSHKRALDNISLTFENAKIHTILGDNGSGKSTLLSIITQEKKQTEGECNVNGNKIAVVHQQPYIAENQTVLENIILGNEPTKLFFFIDYKKAKDEITLLQNTYSIKLNLDFKAKFLDATQRMYTEFLHAVYSKPDFLILDEPTTSLDYSERIVFYQNLLKLKKNNIGIILISHNPEEAITFSDYFYLLQKGKLIHNQIGIEQVKEILLSNTDSTSKINQERNIQNNENELVLSVSNLSSSSINLPTLFDISFSVKKDSVTIISGQKESGLITLEEILTGIKILNWKGEISFFDSTISNKEKKIINPRFLRDHKIAIISSNKIYRDSNPDISVKDMLLVNRFLKNETQKANIDFALDIINNEHIDINLNEKVSNLSGGMLQRLILERELKENPKLLLLFEPVTGLDKNSLKRFSERLIGLTHNGTSILILTSFLDNSLLSIANKHYILKNGYLTETQNQNGEQK